MKDVSDILSNLSKENCEQFIKLSKMLLDLYGVDKKYTEKRMLVVQELTIVEQYYKYKFQKEENARSNKIPIEELNREFAKICNSSDMHNSTVFVTTTCNMVLNTFYIKYRTNKCCSSNNFIEKVLTPRIEKVINLFTENLKRRELQYSIDRRTEGLIKIKVS